MESREIGIVIAAIASIMLIMGIISMARSSAEAGVQEETVPATTVRTTVTTTNYWDYYKQKHPETTELPEPEVTDIAVSSEKTEETVVPGESYVQPDATDVTEGTGIVTEVQTETGADGVRETSAQTKKTAYTLIVTTRG